MSENNRTKSLVAVVMWLVLHAICGAALLWLLVVVVPKSEKIFKDFGAPLPDLTVAFINASHLFGHFWYMLLPGLCLLDFAIIFALHRAKRSGLLMTWGILILFAAIILMAAILIAMIVPLDNLMNNPSGGKA